MQEQVFTPLQEEILRIAFRHLDEKLGINNFNQQEQFAKLLKRIEEANETDE
jgi:hypothetical protein